MKKNIALTNQLELFKSILGNPYYENEYGLIYNMDCLTAMKAIPAEIIDLTFTSPPYNIGKEYEKIMELDDYLLWCEQWIDEIHRITKKEGSFWLNVGYLSIPSKGKAVPIPYLLWDISKFYFQQEIVWNYGAGVSARKILSPRNEKIMWFLKDYSNYTFNLDDIRDKNVKYPNQKKNGKLKCNPMGKNPSDVWQIPKVTSGKNRSSLERVEHPAQTPRELIDRVILAGSNINELIFDPFLGSGSTFESAIANKRKFIGFEIRKDYCEIAISRIEEFIKKARVQTLPLFAVNL